jgi:hypothetical protein
MENLAISPSPEAKISSLLVSRELKLAGEPKG